MNAGNIATAATLVANVEAGVMNPLQGKNNAAQQQQMQDIDSSLGMSEDQLKLMKRWATGYRLYNIGCCALMFAASILQLSSTDVPTVFIALYVFVFSTLLCCFEVAFKQATRFIVMNFGFMYSPFGRIIFLLFVAMMCIKLGLIGYAATALVSASAMTYIFIVCKFPKYEEYMRKNHFNMVK